MPTVVWDGGAAADIGYRWGEISPTATASMLTFRDGNAVWEPVSSITCSENASDGKLFINTAGARAGTYKLTVSWQYNGHLLYSKEIIIFVRFHSGGQ